MSQLSVPMAIVDFIPVLIFFVAIIYLQKDLYDHVKKDSYALMSAGTAMVFIAGFYKAYWKILGASKGIDWASLSLSQFPMMAPGYLFIFLGFLTVITGKEMKSYWAAVIAICLLPLFKSNVFFIILQTLSCEGFYILLMIQAKRKKKVSALLSFIVSAIFVMMMGYLGSKFDDSSSMHWVAQLTNIVAQGAFSLGVWILHKTWKEA